MFVLFNHMPPLAFVTIFGPFITLVGLAHLPGVSVSEEVKVAFIQCLTARSHPGHFLKL